MGNLIDEHLGRRIRQRRLMFSVSEKSLGQAVRRTVFEIKRYEMGIDRIEASVLFNIAEALDVPVTYFFEGLKFASPSQNADKETHALDVDATELIAAYHCKSPKGREKVFIDALARGKPNPGKLS